ncbi:MAG: hypothetical protein CL881_08930 [Dehalococcoidia bacterium]|jgi:hypothetical protein|nr:hypothetical protein [Dehalococcoidia bacterium]
MSQRLGMADGRCFTVSNSSKLYDNFIMSQNGIKPEDNYSFRKLLQAKGPDVNPEMKRQNDGSVCGMCDSTLNLSKIN